MSPAFNALGVDPDLKIEFLPLAVVSASVAFEFASDAAVCAATIESYVLPYVI